MDACSYEALSIHIDARLLTSNKSKRQKSQQKETKLDGTEREVNLSVSDTNMKNGVREQYMLYQY